MSWDDTHDGDARGGGMPAGGSDRYADALAHALHDAAAAAPAPGVVDRLGAVRTRVRRRRAAKRAAAGAATLGVAGLLGAGLTQLPTWLTSAPPPAGPSGTTAPPSPRTETPTDPTGPTAGAGTPSVQDGYRPPWLEQTDVVCGMPADEFAGALGAAGARLELDVRALGAESPVSPAGVPVLLDLRNASTETVEGNAPQSVAFAWMQAGRLVSVGPDELETVVPLPAIEPGGSHAVSGELRTTSYCAPDDAGEYHEHLPPGQYAVIAYHPVFPGADYDPATVFWVTSEPIRVSLAADGTVDQLAG